MDDNARYEGLRNDEEQYSLWLAGHEVPAGWHRVGKEGTKEECSAYVDEVWTDMRPRSLREFIHCLTPYYAIKHRLFARLDFDVRWIFDGHVFGSQRQRRVATACSVSSTTRTRTGPGNCSSLTTRATAREASAAGVLRSPHRSRSRRRSTNRNRDSHDPPLPPSRKRGSLSTQNPTTDHPITLSPANS